MNRAPTRHGLTALAAALAMTALPASSAPPPAPAKAAQPPAACATYADKLCAEVGDPSETCAAVRAVVADLLPAAACTAGLGDLAYTRARLTSMKASCAELAERLCADLGAATMTCAMVRAQTPQFPPARCAGLMREYAGVLAELQRMEARNKPLSASDQAALVAEPVPGFGETGARVTVVVFSDFQCPYCAEAGRVVTRVKDAYGDRVHLVFRQFPLSFHPDANLAAQAALAAHTQGKFWPFHDQLFAHQDALTRADLERYAAEAGLDVAAFKRALDDGKYGDAVAADLKLGERVGVDGTPTMFVNGKRAGNPIDYDAVKALLDAEIATSKERPASP